MVVLLFLVAESVECTLLKTLSGLHTRSVYSIDIMRQDDVLYIVTGGGDDIIHVVAFDPVSEEITIEVQHLHAHGQDVNCVRWRPSTKDHDGNNSIGVIASAGDDGVVTVWNVIP